MRYPFILHHGAVSGVTGSCHQLQMGAEHALLVDCGLFQGAETSLEGRAGANRLDIDFSLAGIRALVATHVHIDHVGRIPYLLAAGFKGPILCSEPSAKLLPIVLEDAFKLGFSRDQAKLERYLKLIEQRIVALPYKTWFNLVDSAQLQARIRLQRAGHILGSAYVEVDLHYPPSGERKRVVFSGDLGAPHAPILPAPKAPHRADILVIESAYGDRLHENRRNRRKRLPVFSNGVDEAFVKIAADMQRALPDPAAEPVKVLYAGNLGDGQGMHLILPELARRLRGRAHFRVVGAGGRLEPLREALRSMGLDNVDLFPPVAREQLLEFYREADVLFLHLNDYPAFKRVLPSKLFEYAATGKPIWAGVAGYAAKFVATEVDNAAIFKPCDIDGALESFERLTMQLADRSDFVGRHARRRIMDEMAQDVMQLLE